MIDKIKTFEQLEQGWDGYDAPPIDSTVSEKAIELLAKGTLPRHESLEVFPTGRSTIQFEYTDFKGREAEFEIFGTEEGKVLLEDSSGNFEVVSGSTEECISAVKKFFDY